MPSSLSTIFSNSSTCERQGGVLCWICGDRHESGPGGGQGRHSQEEKIGAKRERMRWRGINIFTQEATWVGAPVYTGGICALPLGNTSQWQAAKQDCSQGLSLFAKKELCQCKLWYNEVYSHLHLLKTALWVNTSSGCFSWWAAAEWARDPVRQGSRGCPSTYSIWSRRGNTQSVNKLKCPWANAVPLPAAGHPVEPDLWPSLWKRLTIKKEYPSKVKQGITLHKYCSLSRRGTNPPGPIGSPCGKPSWRFTIHTTADFRGTI